jgi:hypothetical protein
MVGKRQAAVVFLGLLLALVALQSQGVTACDGDGICEPGESLDFCGDCSTAYCGDSSCDPGKGEDICGAETHCAADCGLCPGSSCSSTSQCPISYSCCPSSAGTCTATCTSDQGWDAACPAPAGQYQGTGWKYWYDCDGGCQVPTCKFDCSTPKPGTDTPCQKWSCSETTGWKFETVARGTSCSDFAQMIGSGSCDGTVCEAPCSGICASTKPSNTDPGVDYRYCSSTSALCYACTDGTILKDGACVPSCTSQSNHYCLSTIPQNAIARTSYACTSAPHCITCNDGYTFNSNTQTCEASCIDVNCAKNTYQCSGNLRQQCLESGTCQYWSTLNNCADQGLICSNGQCTASCTPQASRGCEGNSAYWYDSCGVRGTLIQTCTSQQLCQAGECKDYTLSLTGPGTGRN